MKSKRVKCPAAPVLSKGSMRRRSARSSWTSSSSSRPFHSPSRKMKQSSSMRISFRSFDDELRLSATSCMSMLRSIFLRSIFPSRNLGWSFHRKLMHSVDCVFVSFHTSIAVPFSRALKARVVEHGSRTFCAIKVCNACRMYFDSHGTVTRWNAANATSMKKMLCHLIETGIVAGVARRFLNFNACRRKNSELVNLIHLWIVSTQTWYSEIYLNYFLNLRSSLFW